MSVSEQVRARAPFRWPRVQSDQRHCTLRPCLLEEMRQLAVARANKPEPPNPPHLLTVAAPCPLVRRARVSCWLLCLSPCPCFLSVASVASSRRRGAAAHPSRLSAESSLPHCGGRVGPCPVRLRPPPVSCCPHRPRAQSASRSEGHEANQKKAMADAPRTKTVSKKRNWQETQGKREPKNRSTLHCELPS